MTLNIGIVGCGKIADAHVEEIQKLSCARLAAVCDLEPIIAEQLAVRYAVPKWYTDFDRMVAEQQLDVIHITTPPHSHLALTQKAVRAGCHVFLEKPLSLNAMDGRSLVECVQKAGKKLTINYWPNFETQALALKDYIAKGELGEIVHVESYYGYDWTGSFGEALLADDRHWVHKLPGKLLHNVIDHALNKITPFLTDETPEVVARAYRRQQPPEDDHTDTVLDELRVMILGRRVSAYATFCSHSNPVSHFLRVYGAKSTVHVDYASRSFMVEVGQTFPSAIGRLLPPFKSTRQSLRQATRNVRDFARSRFHFFEGLNRLLTLFYQSIMQDSPVPISYAEILRVSALMDDVFAQVYKKELL
jgi:predicted dehydrogenase